MLKLYEYEPAIDKFFADNVDENGEITNPEKLSGLFADRNTKIKNCVHAYKSLLATADAIKTERKTLQSREKQYEKDAEWLKGYIEEHVEKGETIEAKTYNISWRNSKRCHLKKDFCNPDGLPDKYRRVKIEANFEALNKLCKQGDNDYAYLEEIKNIQIK